MQPSHRLAGLRTLLGFSGEVCGLERIMNMKGIHMKSEDLFGTESRSAPVDGCIPGNDATSHSGAFELAAQAVFNQTSSNGLNRALVSPTCTLETITPELAQEWLGVNTHNRNLRQMLADAYARDIINNKWPITGATISFDIEGKLLDGQHRLTAIINANKSIKSFVIRNLPLEARAVTDTGQSRTASDALRLENYKHSNKLPPVIRNMLMIKLGSTFIPRVTNSEVIELVCKHPNLINSIQYCQASQVISASVLATVHYIATLSNAEEKANEFATILIDGLGVSNPNNPAFRWREYLSKIKSQRPVLLKFQLLGTCLAWHHFSQGTELKMFRIPSAFYNQSFNIDKI